MSVKSKIILYFSQALWSDSEIPPPFCSETPLFPQGAGTDEHALIEILVTRSNEQIHAMNAAYLQGNFDLRYINDAMEY